MKTASGAYFAAVLFWSMPVTADTYQAVPVTLPDGKPSVVILNTKTGHAWVLACDTNCAEPNAPDNPFAGFAKTGRVLEPLWFRPHSPARDSRVLAAPPIP